MSLNCKLKRMDMKLINQLIRIIMKHFLIIFFILTSISSFGQIPIENFNDCGEKSFFATAQEKPQFDNSGQNVYDYLNQQFSEAKLFENVSGKVLIGILVFDNGKTCCKSFGNMTGKEINSKKVKEIIDEMPDWKPAVQNGEPVNFLYNLMLTFENGKIIKK